MARFSVYLPDDLFARLVQATSDEGNVSAIIQKALDNYLPKPERCSHCGHVISVPVEVKELH
jgi:metal-responsive CopG/Arc/MetJ family transcriptional regulator